MHGVRFGRIRTIVHVWFHVGMYLSVCIMPDRSHWWCGCVMCALCGCLYGWLPRSLVWLDHTVGRLRIAVPICMNIYIYICMVVPLFALPVAGVCPLSLHILLLVVCRCPRPVAGSCLCSLWVLVCVMCVCRIGWRSCRPCGYYICMSLYMFFCLLVCVNTCLCGPRLLVGMPLRCGCSHACPPTCCLSGVCTQHRCDDTGR